MAARHIPRHPMLFGLTSLLAALAVTAPVQAQSSLVNVGQPAMASAPAVPCTPQTTGAEWFSAGAAPSSLNAPAVAPSHEATADTTTAQHFAANLRPAMPFAETDGVAAATLAGAALMMLGGWRWYRTSRLPWPPEPAFDNERIGVDPATVAGWHLSGFEDLPGAEPERPMRPLYDSLDDLDVIDVEPLPARG